MIKKINKEDAEYGVDSRYKSNKERINDGAALMEERLLRIKNLSKDQIIHSKLLQLKYKMEEHVQNPIDDNRHHFSEFLSVYIDTIYNKRSSFAKDIDITPVSLSQVINNHREPKEEFIQKLMIHSEKAYKNVCEFSEKTWIQIYFQDKIFDTISNQKKWRPRIEKHVRLSESI